MALMILVAITILYGGNFYLLSHEYLKAPPVIAPRSLGNNAFHSVMASRNEFVRALQQLEQVVRNKNTDKVNWKEEGF